MNARDAKSTKYQSVARKAWQSLAGSAEDIIDADALRNARAIVDPDGWIAWAGLKTVLCLGAGGGWQAPLIASLGPAVTVVDISSRQLDWDRLAADRHGFEIECVEADMVDLSQLGDRSFDLVYQPISTCYLPDLTALYRTVASVTGPRGLYWSEHWSATQIQLDETTRWDGSAYRISQPVGTGEPIDWHSAEPVDGEVVSCWHYAHSLGQLLGGLCVAGFSIECLTEPAVGDTDAEPDSQEHLAAYLPPFIRVLARRTPKLGVNRRAEGGTSRGRSGT